MLEKKEEDSKNQNLSFETAKLKSEASDTVKLRNNLNDYQQKCATDEEKLKEVKSKLKNQSKLYNKMLGKLDRKQEQLTKFKAKIHQVFERKKG